MRGRIRSSCPNVLKVIAKLSYFNAAITQVRSVETHKTAVRADRRIKEMEFTNDENRFEARICRPDKPGNGPPKISAEIETIS